jgi:hypothetical protein
MSESPSLQADLSSVIDAITAATEALSLSAQRVDHRE